MQCSVRWVNDTLNNGGNLVLRKKAWNLSLPDILLCDTITAAGNIKVLLCGITVCVEKPAFNSFAFFSLVLQCYHMKDSGYFTHSQVIQRCHYDLINLYKIEIVCLCV
jgi:hypothetical protein